MNKPETMTNLYELLKKYVSHVGDCEGVNFIDDCNNGISSVHFTNDEITWLNHIDETLRDEYENETN